jgi:hypothetical protein
VLPKIAWIAVAVVLLAGCTVSAPDRGYDLVTLVLPDPIQFGEIGLQHCLDGVPCNDRTPIQDGDPTEDTNPLGTNHTVVALALSVNQDPIPGTTIVVEILSGPNVGAKAQGVTDQNGEIQLTYLGDGGVGTDVIQASIGNLESNELTKVWEDDGGNHGGSAACDMDDSGGIDRTDIRAIARLRGTEVDPGDLGDYDSDGKITRRDVKLCIRAMQAAPAAAPAARAR